MKKEELNKRIENAMSLEEILKLSRGFHVAENVVGQEIFIWRETEGEGYSLMFKTNKKDELYVEDFDEEGNLYNVRYEIIEGLDEA